MGLWYPNKLGGTHPHLEKHLCSEHSVDQEFLQWSQHQGDSGGSQARRGLRQDPPMLRRVPPGGAAPEVGPPAGRAR